MESSKVRLLDEDENTYNNSPRSSNVVGFDGLIQAPESKGSLNASFNDNDKDILLIHSSFENDVSKSPEYKQTRIQTIMSIVNTMMGTTIVALPFGLAEAGIGTGLVIIGILGAISAYTCLIIVESSQAGTEEFSACVKQFLGRRVQLLAWAISVAIILGAAIIYHILMQETLYALVTTLILSGNPNSTLINNWQRVYAALVPWFLFPISNMKDLSALVKVNSIGFIFLAYVILFIVSHGIHVLLEGRDAPLAMVSTLSASSTTAPYTSSGILQIIVGGTSSFASLGGMMMLSFFIHNCIQPIIKNANPATRRMDIIIAYCIAGIFYSFVGILGYIGFVDAHSQDECAYSSTVSTTSSSSSTMTVGHILYGFMTYVSNYIPGVANTLQVVNLNPLPSSSPCVLKSNFLAMFGTDLGDASDIYAFSARVALLFQLFTVFPILLLIIRTQVFSLVLGTPWPGSLRVAGLNFLVMGITFAFAATDLQISEVMRFVGAIGGFVIVFAVPAAIDYVKRKDESTASWLSYSREAFIITVGLFFLIVQFIPA